MLRLRKARSADTAKILYLIRELAEYEKEPHAVETTESDLKRDGFDKTPKFQAVIAEWSGKLAGMAFYFYHYSTWKGRAGLYLEDIFVRPEFRGKRIGEALMSYLARAAIRQNCYGIRWEVLDWNKPAIRFYKNLGARFREHWQAMQLQGDDLRHLAGHVKPKRA